MAHLDWYLCLGQQQQAILHGASTVTELKSLGGIPVAIPLPILEPLSINKFSFYSLLFLSSLLILLVS